LEFPRLAGVGEDDTGVGALRQEGKAGEEETQKDTHGPIGAFPEADNGGVERGHDERLRVMIFVLVVKVG
jgi:hypothetical protein